MVSREKDQLVGHKEVNRRLLNVRKRYQLLKTVVARSCLGGVLLPVVLIAKVDRPIKIMDYFQIFQLMIPKLVLETSPDLSHIENL